MSEWKTSKLHDWVAANDIELGRGNIISKDDINAFPGSYPIYSSSAHNNGKFGEYAEFMFDEELITWSVDGGGSLFYRPKHKFSVTNVCGYMRIKTADLHAPFIYYCLAEQHKHQTFDYTTKAHPSVIRKLYWLPKLDVQVQQKIACILQTIDQAIEKTEALIEKYQHIKAGLMHDLFTRGIGADGQLRPPREQAPELYQHTPIGWIPTEWKVKLLGVLAEIVSGVTLGAKGEISDEIEVPYLRVANVQDGYLDLTEVKTVRVSRTQLEKLQLQFGDVLMNEGGDFDKLGRGSVWQEEIKPCIHQNHVFRVRPRDGQLRSYFLAFWSQSEMGKKYFVLNSKQSTNLASINSTQLNRFPVALPSSIEQARIEARIIAHNGCLDSLGQELAKLRQQKSGLMHDLLTGKVPVQLSEPNTEASA
jgi:type I restriction enzyme S subunit